MLQFSSQRRDKVPVSIVDVERHVRVIISMMLLCNDIVIIEYDERRPWLPNAPVVKENENNKTEI